MRAIRTERLTKRYGDTLALDALADGASERPHVGVVVVQQAVPGLGISLDVVVDAGRDERRLEAIGNTADPGPPIPDGVSW
jgi:hypothetical protein